VGIPALYLARTIEGCFLEQAHGFPLRFDPLTVCTYDLDIEEMVDLTTDPGRDTANVQLSELQCSWAEDMAAGKEPASWKVAKRLIGEGASGIIVPSFARGARPDMHNAGAVEMGT
jgi:RES domain-containing protein